MFRDIFKPLALWCSLVSFCLVIAGLYLIPIFFIFSQELPDYSQLKEYNPPSISRIYSYQGDKIAELSKERRIYEKIEDIPNLVIKAFLAAEDQNYFSHPGIDVVSIVRAAMQNIANNGTDKNPVGGSTITQQVVKNFLLSNERSIARKIKEAILAYRINNVFSKEQILELYLNQIYLGNGSYGIKAAAIDYFNKDLNELNVEEAALLAALPKAPSSLDPFKYPEKAKRRRDWVIDRMSEEGFISKYSAQQAKHEAINLHPKNPNNEYNQTYYSEAVRLEVMKTLGEKSLYEDGLTIHTNLVQELQDIADKALMDGLLQYDKRHGYKGVLKNYVFEKDKWQQKLSLEEEFTHIKQWQKAICIDVQDKKITIGLKNGDKGVIDLSDILWARKRLKDNYVGKKIKSAKDVLKKGDVILVEKKNKGKNNYLLQQVPDANGALIVMQPITGKILALSGGFNFKMSNYNRALQAQRQPGSTFKPFVYLSALEQGYSPLSVVKDEPLSISQGEGKPDWTPKNYSGNFMGPITIRTALEKSRNLATIRVLMAAGIKNVANISERFGIYNNPPEVFSMALGSHETTLHDIVAAYASIASGGVKIKPSLINRINDINGRLIYSSDHMRCPKCHSSGEGQILSTYAIPNIESKLQHIVSPQTNYQLLSMLTGVVQNGTGRRAKLPKHVIAGKTGTSNKSNDTWFIGFSPDIVAGVYVGYDSPRTLGQYENGAVTALPIFANFMKNALKNVDSKNFVIPEGIEIIEVDQKTGQPANLFTQTYDVIREALKQNELLNYKEILEKQVELRLQDEGDGLDDVFYNNQADDISGVY